MSPREIVYLGWQGFGNFGDDLLHETWRLALGRPLEVEAPLNGSGYRRRIVRFAADRLRLIGSERIVLLGGGTTVGFANWAAHVDLARRCYGARAVITAGAGAAASHDLYSTSAQPQDWSAWRAVRNVVLMGVRGPSTAREVEAAGMPAPVVGDPALLYPELRAVEPVAGPARIGVALGSDPTSRFDLAVIGAAVDRHAAAEGISEVVLFALSDADRTTARELAAMLETPTRIHEYVPGGVHETMQELAGCSVVVSERLHGAIPAVALGVPTVPLSYASKCDDFWESVTGSVAPITVGHTVDELVDALRSARSGVDTSRVRALQDALSRAAAALRDWLDGTQPIAAIARWTPEAAA
jgi:polysaccharide pyruvyl transferase WcaK-like protein